MFVYLRHPVKWAVLSIQIHWAKTLRSRAELAKGTYVYGSKSVKDGLSIARGNQYDAEITHQDNVIYELEQELKAIQPAT